MPDEAAAPAAPGPDLPRALRDAGITALIALGLFLPLIGFSTITNIRNELVLETRWRLLIIIVAIIATLRFVQIAFLAPYLAHRRTTRAAKPVAAPWPRPWWTKYAVIAALIAYPLFAVLLNLVLNDSAAPAGKWIDNYGIQILIYVMLGWGLNIVVGYAGLLDLGYVAFYAIGAYTSALLSLHFGLTSFWMLLPLAGILAAFWGMILGFPVLRLRGDYLAVVTLAFGEIIHEVCKNWVAVTKGEAGIYGLPRPTLFGIPFDASSEGFAARFGLPPSGVYRQLFLYYVLLGAVALAAVIIGRLRRLPIGRSWEALREDEIACRSLGINTTNSKLTAFAIGAFFGGIAGAFFAARQDFISAASVTFNESALILAIVVLGGMGSSVGVAIAAILIIGGTELLRELDFLKQIFGSDFHPEQYRMVLFGLAMVIIIAWKPRGLVSTRDPTIVLKERKTIDASLVREGHG